MMYLEVRHSEEGQCAAGEGLGSSWVWMLLPHDELSHCNS